MQDISLAFIAGLRFDSFFLQNTSFRIVTKRRCKFFSLLFSSFDLKNISTAENDAKTSINIGSTNDLLHEFFEIFQHAMIAKPLTIANFGDHIKLLK